MKLFILQAYLLTDEERVLLEGLASHEWPLHDIQLESCPIVVTPVRFEVRKEGVLVAFFEKDT